MVGRILALTILVIGLVAAPAAGAEGIGFARIAKGPLSSGEGPLLAGDEVLVGRERAEGGVVEVFGLDGGPRRTLTVERPFASVFELAASEQAVAMVTDDELVQFGSAPPRAGTGFGPVTGPLRAFPFFPSDVEVAGPLVAARRYDESVLHVWDVTAPGAPPRDVAVGDTITLGAAGRFVAVLDGRPSRQWVVVTDLVSGAVVQRVRTRGFRNATVAPDGRVAIIERDAKGLRVVAAGPGGPRRELARLKLSHHDLAASGTGVAVVRRGPGRLAQLVIVGYDGSIRAVTPPVNGVEEPDLEGGRLAFGAGRCVFAGAVPAEVPDAAPRDWCFGATAELSFRRLDRMAQRRGSHVRVPLTCTVPPRNRCTAHLRLEGPGFVVHERARLRPGRRTVRVRIPGEHRRAAWRRGMSLTTIERGERTAGAAIPN